MSALGLQDEKELFKEAKSLNPLFRVRNEIAHDLDMTPESLEAAAPGTDESGQSPSTRPCVMVV